MSETISQVEELAPIKRVCAMTGLSKSTVYRMIAEGTFPKSVPVRNRALWPISRVHAWCRKQVESHPDPAFDEAA